MIGRWFKQILLYGTEALVAVVLVLVFFFACMTILAMSFPKGAGLRDLMGGTPWNGDGTPAARFRFDRDGALQPVGPKTVARLAAVRDKVKDKKSDRIDWGEARAGATLEERHAVQTFKLSSAVIEFAGHGDVALDANSLIVIGAGGSDEHAKPGEVSLLVTSGAVRATTGGKPGSGGDLRVVTANGEARIGAAAAASDVRISVNPDRSSTFSVHRGSTEVTAEGRTVKVESNRAVTVLPGAAPGDPVPLPRAPVPTTPAANASVSYRTVPPVVKLSWASVPEAHKYRVQLARDAEFERLLDDDLVAGTELTRGNLGPGTYFWRVSAMRGYVESAMSAPRRLTIVEDRVPPFLQVSFPEDSAAQATVVVRGETEPGADVFVGRVRVATDAAGHFSREVDLTPGWNVVVVEAIDAAGNVAYKSERRMAGMPPKARMQ